MRAFLTFASYRLLGALVGRLPARVGYGLARTLGPAIYALSPGLRRNLTSNISHVLGSEAEDVKVKALVRQACVNIAKGHYDLFRLNRMTANEIEAVTHVEGWENMEEALARGTGVIIFTAHVGSVELVMQLAVIRGIPTTAPVLRTKPERLFQFTRALRQSHGLKLIPTDEAMVGLFRALKRGEVIGLAADRDVNDSGYAIDFFGAPTRLPSGPVRVALRTGAAFIPAFAFRREDDSVLLSMEPPLELPHTGDLEADVRAGMELVVATLERQIARHPEQWLVAASIWPQRWVQRPH